MKKDAEKALSESVVVGMRVTPRGLVNSAAMKGAADGLGGLAGAALQLATSTKKSPSEQTPKGYDKAMFLAVTPTRIAFFRINVGIMAHLGTMIAQFPRAEIRSCTVGRARMEVPFFMTRPIDIETTSDDHFSLDTLTPVFFPGTALKLQQEFQSS